MILPPLSRRTETGNQSTGAHHDHQLNIDNAHWHPDAAWSLFPWVRELFTATPTLPRETVAPRVIGAITLTISVRRSPSSLIRRGRRMALRSWKLISLRVSRPDRLDRRRGTCDASINGSRCWPCSGRRACADGDARQPSGSRGIGGVRGAAGLPDRLGSCAVPSPRQHTKPQPGSTGPGAKADRAPNGACGSAHPACYAISGLHCSERRVYQQGCVAFRSYKPLLWDCTSYSARKARA